VTNNWPDYISIRTIKAAKIMDIIDVAGAMTILVKPYEDDRIERFVPSMKGAVSISRKGDYAVVYPGGFCMVIAKDLFESGYILLADV
jgi:hypothetical protein